MQDHKTGWRNLVLFFSITFAFSWVFWVPQALVSKGMLTAAPWLSEFLFSPYNPAAFGPLVGAVVLTYTEGGKERVAALFRKITKYRIGQWYLPVFLVSPAIMGLALLMAVLSGDPLPELAAFSDPLTLLFAFAYIFFLGGPFQEEFGWRGYALENLQQRRSAFTSSAVLGAVWGAWHLPLFYIQGTIQSQTPIWGFFVLIICGAFLFTWIYNNTGGSVLAVMIYHTMNNLAYLIFPTLETETGGLYLLILNVLAVAVVLKLYGAKKMVRGNVPLNGND
ncbi:MAG: type II CAAX endopeptidase family protein [Candidatus Methanosuratincola sp.]